MRALMLLQMPERPSEHDLLAGGFALEHREARVGISEAAAANGYLGRKRQESIDVATLVAICKRSVSES